MENQPQTQNKLAPILVYLFLCGIIVGIPLSAWKILPHLKFAPPRQLEGGDNPATFGRRPVPHDTLYTGGEYCTDFEFSPDGKLIAVTESDGTSPGVFATKIYRLPEGNIDGRQLLITTIPACGCCCAWSDDGGTVAVISSNTPGVDVFETTTWKKIQHLEPPDKIKRLRTLFFDARGNLFATGDREHVSAFTHEYRPCIWWRGTSQLQTIAEKIEVPDADSVFSIEAINDGDSIRMVIAYHKPFGGSPSPLNIFRIQHNDETGTAVVKESAITGMSPAWVKFAGLGNFIGVLQEDDFQVLRLEEGEEEIVWMRSYPGDFNPELRYHLRNDFETLAVSRDGRFLAGVPGGDCALVVRVADQRPVLEIQEMLGFPALSPDGALLAVRTPSSHILFFRVPQD